MMDDAKFIQQLVCSAVYWIKGYHPLHFTLVDDPIHFQSYSSQVI